MEILRYTAFSTDPAGGNPAGVVLDATDVTDAQMLTVAADLGYSETAFLVPRGGNRAGVRYFSPQAEVPFCGHATIATAVAHADRYGPGQLTLETSVGVVEVATSRAGDGTMTATLTSVPPRTVGLADEDLSAILTTLGWKHGDLDPQMPPRVSFAGAWHPIIAVSTRARLADLDYDMAALGELMRKREWTTVNLIWRESAGVIHSRNPFPPGGIVEDPATGAAAAALGGYLRELKLVDTPAVVTVFQGQDLGRPSTLSVTIGSDSESGIGVTGTAVVLPH